MAKESHKGMERCEQCANRDRERSTENWTVCPVIPLDVMVSGTSNECEEFVPLVDIGKQTK